MSTFEERIAKAITDKLNDGTVEELVSDAVTKALKSSIEEQFRWTGDARKVIDQKVKEVMTPAIERVSLDDYVVKLDAILTEIINSTNLVDNKEILGNFKNLMTEPDKDVISLKTYSRNTRNMSARMLIHLNLKSAQTIRQVIRMWK